MYNLHYNRDPNEKSSHVKCEIVTAGGLDYNQCSYLLLTY